MTTSDLHGPNPGAAALVSLSAYAGLSVTEPGRRVGPTQSTAARMVYGQEADGLVERSPSPLIKRVTTVHPTPDGRQAVRRLLAARGSRLIHVVGAQDENEQRMLANLPSKLVDASVRADR